MFTRPVILTVDRNTDNLELMQHFLSENGFHVVTASTLDEVGQALQGTVAIRLALLDTAGFDRRIWDYCELMRKAGIPFLVISPRQRQAVREEGLPHEAGEAQVKPPAQRELLVVLHCLLGETPYPR